MCSLALALLWSALWRFANSPSLSSMLTVLAMVVAVLGWWHPPLATSTSSTIDDLVGRLLSSRRFSIDSVVAIGCGEGAIRLDGSASSALHDGLEGLCDGTARQWTARRPRCMARRHTMDWTGSEKDGSAVGDEWLSIARGLDLHQWCM